MKLTKYVKKFKESSKKNLLIGLTGGIGSGKSTALKFFEKYGCYVVSADDKVKKILTNKKNCDKILLRYPEVSDRFGLLDKKKLALLIFKNKRVKKFIEGLIHPEVISEILKEIRNIEGKVIAVEIPLLFESGLEEAFDLVVSVVCDNKKRVERLVKRGMSKSEIYYRIKAQETDETRIRKSDAVIYNDGSISGMEKEVKNLCGILKEIIK